MKRVSVSERRRRFLEALERGCSVVEAVRYAGVVRSTVYAWAEADAAFAAAWKAAEEASIGSLRSKAYDLAMGGNTRLIMWLIERYEGWQREEVQGVGGVVEIVGLEEGERRDGDFIEFG